MHKPKRPGELGTVRSQAVQNHLYSPVLHCTALQGTVNPCLWPAITQQLATTGKTQNKIKNDMRR